jgi:hypothetical protein
MQYLYGIITSKRRNESMVSKAKIAANARYNLKKYDVISFRASKDESINQRIDDTIQGTGTSKAAFILDAIRAKLDGPQPGQAPHPDTTTATPAAVPEGYTLIPCRPDQEPLKVLLPVDKHYNQRIQALVKAGRAPSRAVFVMQALDKHLSDAQPRDQYELPDEFFTGDPADNPPPLQ